MSGVMTNVGELEKTIELARKDGLQHAGVIHPSVSYSELMTLARCMKKHDYHYRQGLRPKVEAKYFSKGKYLHHLCEEMLSSYSDVEPSERPEEEVTAALDPKDRKQVDTIFEQFRESFLLRDPPEVLAIEQEFEVNLGLYPSEQIGVVLLRGFWDAVIRDAEGHVWIIDWKTASRKRDQASIDLDWQMRLYLKAWEAITGERPAGGRLVYFLPKSWLVETIFTTDAEMQQILGDINTLIELRHAELLTPVRQPMWGCRDCAFKELCIDEMQGFHSNLRGEQFITVEAKL